MSPLFELSGGSLPSRICPVQKMYRTFRTRRKKSFATAGSRLRQHAAFYHRLESRDEQYDERGFRFASEAAGEGCSARSGAWAIKEWGQSKVIKGR
jgi:hypothetical protein